MKTFGERRKQDIKPKETSRCWFQAFFPAQCRNPVERGLREGAGGNALPGTLTREKQLRKAVMSGVTRCGSGLGSSLLQRSVEHPCSAVRSVGTEWGDRTLTGTTASSEGEGAVGTLWGMALKEIFYLPNTSIMVYWSALCLAVLCSEDAAVSEKQGQETAVRETEHRARHCVWAHPGHPGTPRNNGGEVRLQGCGWGLGLCRWIHNPVKFWFNVLTVVYVHRWICAWKKAGNTPKC